MKTLLDRWFGRRAPPVNTWVCATCGQSHDDLPAVTVPAPLVWSQASEQEQAEHFELTSDTCVWNDEHFFIRACLDLPFSDRDGTFQFGVWTTLSRENFLLYLETFDDGEKRVDLPPMFGWFSNSLPGYPETLNLKCTLHPREAGLRPSIELEPSDHPLARQQREGIPFEEAVAYVHTHLGL